MNSYYAVSARTAETRILASISGLWTSRLIGIAVKLRIFEAIDARGKTASEVAAERDLAAGPLCRVLDGLAHLGLLARREDRYFLTPDGELMLPDAAGGFCDMAALWFDLFDGAWAELGETIRTGKPGFDIRYGKPIFEHLGNDAEALAHFTGAMRGLSQLIGHHASRAIADRLDELGMDSVCDVGGGDGFLISAIKRLGADRKCALLDLPQVVGPCRQSLMTNGIGALEGSFFDGVPKADAHILSNVIHDWQDAEAVQILRTVREAQERTGRLFLLEMMLGGEDEPPLARSTDLNMLLLTGGRERTRGEFAALLAAASYEIGDVRSIAGLTCLIEAAPISQH